MSEVKTNKISSLASNNDITLDPDGTGDVVVAAGHKLGIGTTSPDTSLHISADSSARLRLEDTTNNVKADILVGNTSSVIGNASNHDLAFMTNDINRMTIDSDGDVGIGAAPNATFGSTLYVQDTPAANKPILSVYSQGNSNNAGIAILNDAGNRGIWTESGNLRFTSSYEGNSTEHMRILSGGAVTVSSDADESPYNNSGNDPATVLNAFNIGLLSSARSGGDPAAFNRTTNDGDVVSIYQDGTFEGSLRVSGSTVSLVGGHLCRWSQTSDGSKDTSIVRGTVMTNLNEMCEWKQVSFDYVTTDDEGNQRTIPKKIGYGGDADVGQTVTVQFQGNDVTGTVVAEDNEQLNRMAVSSVEGDVNVSGVMDSWDEDDDNYDDMTVAMTGDFVIRIASGTTVARGELLMSAGDGTAKSQGDDIVRSKTIAKVTSTTVSHTYDDGTYLVPCVLMAC